MRDPTAAPRQREDAILPCATSSTAPMDSTCPWTVSIRMDGFLPAAPKPRRKNKTRPIGLVFFFLATDLRYIVLGGALSRLGFEGLCRLSNVYFGRNHSRQIQMQFKHLQRRHIKFFLLFRIPALHTKQLSLPVRMGGFGVNSVNTIIFGIHKESKDIKPKKKSCPPRDHIRRDIWSHKVTSSLGSPSLWHSTSYHCTYRC